MKAGETLKSRGVPMKNKTKRKNRIFWVLLATMLILFGVSFRNDGKIGISGVQSVQAATKNVVVRFWNQSGKTSYSKLRIKVSAGTKIKLPAVPAITGYKINIVANRTRKILFFLFVLFFIGTPLLFNVSPAFIICTENKYV